MLFKAQTAYGEVEGRIDYTRKQTDDCALLHLKSLHIRVLSKAAVESFEELRNRKQWDVKISLQAYNGGPQDEQGTQIETILQTRIKFRTDTTKTTDLGKFLVTFKEDLTP